MKDFTPVISVLCFGSRSDQDLRCSTETKVIIWHVKETPRLSEMNFFINRNKSSIGIERDFISEFRELSKLKDEYFKNVKGIF